MTPDVISSSPTIGNTTFNPGVIQLDNVGGVTVGGTSPNNEITLDGTGVYVFQVINGDLVSSPTTSPVFFNLLNGAKASDVYWVVSGNVDLQTNGGNITAFAGNIIVQGDISMGTSSTSAGTLAAPSASGTITLNNNVVTCRVSQQILDNYTNDYINITTTLADNQAIRINAANAFGGILINAGFGGITIDSTNSISIDAQAASNFNTTVGDLTIQADTGILNLEGGGGINLGNDPSSSIINIGSASNSKLLNIGNTFGTTQIQMSGGTSGILLDTANGGTISLDTIGASSNFTVTTNTDGQNLTLSLLGSTDSEIIIDSTGTGSDAIFLNSFDGIHLFANTDIVSLESAATVSNAINFNTASGGGISMSGGSLGIAISTSNGGITLGSGAAGIGINTSSGGAIGIGHFAGGEILLGTASFTRNLTIGNDITGTRLIERFGTGGLFEHQESPTSLPASGSTTVFESQLLTRILSGSPTGNTTLNLNSASTMVSNLGAIIQAGDSFEFGIINNSSTNTYTIIPGTNGISDGNMVVATNASGIFRIRINNTSLGTESYTVFRLA